MLELSTDYSWQYAQEQLTVSTDKGFYVMDGMESLHLTPRRPALLGIPLEKVVGGAMRRLPVYTAETVLSRQSATTRLFHKASSPR